MWTWPAIATPESPAVLVGVAVAVVALIVLVAVVLWRRRSFVSAPAEKSHALARSLQHGLAKTRAGMLHRLLPIIGRSRLDPESAEQLEAALLAADVGLKMTERLMACVRRNGDLPVTGILQREIVDILEGAAVRSPQRPDEAASPLVIVVVGVNGVGKTTSIGKLAARFVRQGKRTLVVAADTFRAAAIEQLTVWAERSGAEIVRQQQGGDPGAVAYDGMKAAAARKAEVVIVDTAGRLHTKSNLMEELRKVCRVIAREIPGAPHETLLVVDAVTGQNGLAQARAFLDDLRITGVILTKLDGTARGGIVLAIAGELGLPIRFVGVGEGIDDLQDFDAREFAAALLASPEASNLPVSGQ